MKFSGSFLALLHRGRQDREKPLVDSVAQGCHFAAFELPPRVAIVAEAFAKCLDPDLIPRQVGYFAAVSA